MSAKPNRVRINKVKGERILFLSPSVKLGHENEANLRDFDIGDMLGSGAFGYVYKVVHKTSKRIFALKVIEKGKIRKNKMEKQIQNEVKIMYSLDCENVVRLFNHFEDDENLYLVMEFAEEGQLMNKIKKAPSKKLPEAVAAAYIRDLVKALDYIHNLSPPIIHRDIKPENLLVSANNTVKLGDFGWSNYSEDSRTTYCGTPEYLAPEMLLQKGHTDKLDIWCVGVLMFELLTGRTPFLPKRPGKDQNDTNRILQKGIIDGKPIIPADYPPIARDLTLKLLKANPKERLSIQDIKKHPWFSQNSVTFGPQRESSLGGFNQNKPKANLAASLLTVDETDELPTANDDNKPGIEDDIEIIKPHREFEVEGKQIAESEMLQEMPDIPDHEASKFFRRESVLAYENIPKLDGINLRKSMRPSIVDRFGDALRKSTGLKTNEVIQKLNDQITDRDQKITDLQNMVEALQIENTRIKVERDRLNSCFSNLSEESSFASMTVPSLETKLTKFVEEERDKLRARVEELYKAISIKEEAIDILNGRMRKYETLEKSNEELKIEKMDLQAQLKDKEDQMNCFSSMVVETKETKNKEISELENRLTDYENKLFVRSKENNELVIRELMEFTNEKFMEISQTIKAYQGQKTKYNDLVAKYQELEGRSKRQELMHRNELADLHASIHDQIEDKLEQCQAKHQLDLNVLKADIIKAKMETEEIVAEKNSRIAQIEKQLVNARAELDKMACQENRIKELEQGLQVKTFLILSKDREFERLRQRIDEKTELNNRLKSTAVMFEK